MTGRDRAILRAVAVGSAELVCGCEPDLVMAASAYSADQAAAHALARWAIVGHIPAPPGSRVLAILTDAGRAALDDAMAGAA